MDPQQSPCPGCGRPLFLGEVCPTCSRFRVAQSLEGQPRKRRALWIAVGFGILCFFVLLLGLGLTVGPTAVRVIQQQSYRTKWMESERLYYGGKYAESAAAASEMIRIDPRRPEGYERRGLAGLQLGQYSEAGRDLTRAIEAAQGRQYLAVLHLRRSGAYRQLGKADQAVKDVEEALRLDPDVRGGRESLLMHLTQARRWPELERVASQDIGAHQALYEAYSARGMARGELHRYSGAVSDLREACRLNPGQPDAYVTLGWFQYEGGDLAGAMRTNQECLERSPDGVAVNFNQGLCYLLKGDSTRARACYKHGLLRAAPQERKAGTEDLQEALGRFPGSAERLREAMEWLSAASN